MNTIVALPTRGTHVDEHFGHCEQFTVFTFDDKGQLTNTELIPSPAGCGCRSDIASVLRQRGVKVLLAGNMGNGAVNVLGAQGISVIRGCSGTVRAVAEAYVNGQVSDSGISCSLHEHHHHHNHEHGHACNHNGSGSE
jgi:predicted Fe-Mo cluster-binding NifX family protein